MSGPDGPVVWDDADAPPVPVRDPAGRIIGRVVSARTENGGLYVEMVLDGNRLSARMPLPEGFVLADDAEVRLHGRALSDAEAAAFDALDDDYAPGRFDADAFRARLAEGAARVTRPRTETVPLPGDPPPPESLYPRPGASDTDSGKCPTCGSRTCAHLVRVLNLHIEMREPEPRCPACGQTAEECGRFVKLVTDDEGSRVVHLDHDPDGETPC